MQIIRLEDQVTPRISMPQLTISASARRVDILTRLMAAAFFSTAVVTKIGELSTFVRQELSQSQGFDKFGFYSSIASRVAVLLFLSLMATLFIVREKPVKKAAGIRPRLLAIAGTFLMSAMTLFPRVEMGVGRTLVSTFLVVLGMGLSVFTLFHLGRSFSLMAEARRLVTSGPYALVRHPLYLCEEIAIVGTLLQFLSPVTLVIFALHLWIQIQRVGNEEAVLRQAFPDYREYQTRTSFKFLPGIC
jgi:protein-S-isoprenylcysteine O-methyltransferase Ste14